MLILNRRKGESFAIETPFGEAVIKIISYEPKTNRVRVGIAAPDEVNVRRCELAKPSSQSGDIAEFDVDLSCVDQLTRE